MQGLVFRVPSSFTVTGVRPARRSRDVSHGCAEGLHGKLCMGALQDLSHRTYSVEGYELVSMLALSRDREEWT